MRYGEHVLTLYRHLGLRVRKFYSTFWWSDHNFFRYQRGKNSDDFIVMLHLQKLRTEVKLTDSVDHGTRFQRLNVSHDYIYVLQVVWR